MKRIILLCAALSLLLFSAAPLLAQKRLKPKEALNIVLGLPEVQNYLNKLKTYPYLKPLTLVEKGWDEFEKDYHLVTIGEVHPDHRVTWERFFVHKKTGEILVYDVVKNKTIDLETWQKEMKKESSWKRLKETVIKADLTANRKEQMQLAKEAIEMANACVAQNPNEAACYYYRGQATGLYYEVKIFGYQKGVRSMIADWEKALELNPQFDHGGPSRMLGELFTALPKYFGPKEVQQDWDKAQKYLESAIQASPDYPAQQLDLAELYLKAKRPQQAKETLQRALNLIPQWLADPYFSSWQVAVSELERRLSKEGVIYGKP